MFFPQNIFHFSFMVKESKAAIKTWTAEEAEEYGGLPGPVVRPQGDENNKAPPRQAIVSLNMKVRNHHLIANDCRTPFAQHFSWSTS